MYGLWLSLLRRIIWVVALVLILCHCIAWIVTLGLVKALALARPPKAVSLALARVVRIESLALAGVARVGLGIMSRDLDCSLV